MRPSRKLGIAARGLALVVSVLILGGCASEVAPPAEPEQEPGARYQPGTAMGMYTPEQHAEFQKTYS